MVDNETTSADQTNNSPTDEANHPVASPFITTTDVLEHLNASLADSGAQFELHKQLPGQSTRLATPSEARANDFQSKLQQAAGHVASLTSGGEKQQWFEQQRSLGNDFLKTKQYADALDVYLTCCLVATEPSPLAQILHHCAVCTLRLQQYQKTMQFCTLAIDKLSGTTDENNISRLCQLYFLRSKAGRLRGDYRMDDLQTCRTLDAERNKQFTKEIDKEQQLLERAMQRAQANQSRQTAALRQLWSNGTNNNESEPLYETRTHSTIRADDPDERNAHSNSYWQYYWEVVGRYAQLMVDWTHERQRRRRRNKRD